MAKYIFWDLDGTLTDSSEGITKCGLLTLEHFGITGYTLDDLKVIIGPPLKNSLLDFGIPKDRIDEAIKVFRGRYNVVGKYENKPFPGISDLLSQLKKEGYKLYVATSKPEFLATDILHKFELDQYFEIICGSAADGKRDSKEDVINYLLSQIDNEVSDALMIGDTEYDVIGAKAHNIPTIVVSWGFGDLDKMKQSGAIGIANTMNELHEMIINHK